jgi:hypothetical protein
MVSVHQGRVQRHDLAAKGGQRVFVGFIVALLIILGVAALSGVF